MSGPELSLILATIDRPEQLEMALMCYTRWDTARFDVWIIDDSGTARINRVCEDFQSKLQLHYARFTEKDPTYWRGPEMAYNLGLRLVQGENIVITQEGILVPCDMLDRLLGYLMKHPVVNVFVVKEHEPSPEGACAKMYGVAKVATCNVPKQEVVWEMFRRRPVQTAELFKWHSIPNFEYDWCSFYAAQRDAWEKMNWFPVDQDFGYGHTDAVLRDHRVQKGLPRFVPPDLEVYHLEVYDRDHMHDCPLNGIRSNAGYEVLY